MLNFLTIQIKTFIMLKNVIIQFTINVKNTINLGSGIMAVKTKKALALTLLDLLEEKSMDDITIIDIVERQGVNRQTFYYHYKSMDEIAEYLFALITENTVGENKTYDTWQKGFESIFKIISVKKNVVRHVWTSKSSAHFDKFLKDTTFNFLYNVIEELVEREDIKASEENKRYLGNIYTSIFKCVLDEWIEGGMKEKPKKVIAKLNSFIQGDFLKKLSILEKEAVNS